MQSKGRVYLSRAYHTLEVISCYVLSWCAEVKNLIWADASFSRCTWEQVYDEKGKDKFCDTVCSVRSAPENTKTKQNNQPPKQQNSK